MKAINAIRMGGADVLPLVEGGKGVAVSNGITAGNWAASGGAGTLSAVNPDSYDADGKPIPQVYHAKTRRDRHEELVTYGIQGGIEQARRAHDIAGGKQRLEELLEERFFPGFTPPWNRCTDDTLRALDQLGFQVFSADRNGQARAGRYFREISITLDLYRWKGGAAMKAPEEIVALDDEWKATASTIETKAVPLAKSDVAVTDFRLVWLPVA